jgi:AcrR family transcriptional regulator
MPAHPPDVRYRRTRAEQVALHAQIIQIAQSLFDEGGLEAVSMRRIAQRANISAMGLYRYFPSKSHLMRHIWDDILQMANARATRDLSARADAQQNLRAYLDGFLQYWLDNRGHWRVVSSISDALFEAPVGGNAPALRPTPQQVLDTLYGLLEGCATWRRESSAWQALVEMLFCKALGFLQAVIGVVAYPWPDVPALKQRVVEDILASVTAAAITASPAQRKKTALR